MPRSLYSSAASLSFNSRALIRQVAIASLPSFPSLSRLTRTNSLNVSFPRRFAFLSPLTTSQCLHPALNLMGFFRGLSSTLGKRVSISSATAGISTGFLVKESRTNSFSGVERYPGLRLDRTSLLASSSNLTSPVSSSILFSSSSVVTFPAFAPCHRTVASPKAPPVPLPEVPLLGSPRAEEGPCRLRRKDPEPLSPTEGTSARNPDSRRGRQAVCAEGGRIHRRRRQRRTAKKRKHGCFIWRSSSSNYA
mmetsp:Transcript_24507/g.48047  ORF Transcript_24507/g.48047 Transcript_24507/m.48047 type:complete len:250 (+) Transcript_24507:2340-3089(+)